jgi:Flp pilus assembly protein TadG
MIRLEPWSRLKRSTIRFWRRRDGATAMTFAMMAVPVTMVAGFSVDLARAHEGREKLQQAVDAAALALAHQPAGTPTATLTAQAQTWINADLHDSDLALPATVNLTQANGQLTLTANTSEPAVISGLAGVHQFNLAASSTAKWGLNHVEVALVLDNTGSMAQNNKLPTLVSSARSLITTLLQGAGNDPNAVKISIVPFGQTVNIGPQYQTASWMSGVMPSAYGSDLFSTAGTNRFTLFQQMNKVWKGCVESRPMPFDAQDTAPSAGTPATLYVPYFAPDEPDTPSGFANNYINDKTSGTWQVRQGYVAKYNGAAPRTGTNSVGYSYGPNSGCGLAPVVRMTNDSATLNNELNQMVATGYTNLAIGMEWGWLTLSPSAPFGDGVAYGAPNTTKVIVFLTDGYNETSASSDSDQSVYSGIGYIWQNRIGVGSGSSQTQQNTALDNRTKAVCANAKAAGVVVYTVRIDVSGVSPAVLQTCASSPDKFYDVPNVANLPVAFQQIAGQIGKLRIAQ